MHGNKGKVIVQDDMSTSYLLITHGFVNTKKGERFDVFFIKL